MIKFKQIAFPRARARLSQQGSLKKTDSTSIGITFDNMFLS